MFPYSVYPAAFATAENCWKRLGANLSLPPTMRNFPLPTLARFVAARQARLRFLPSWRSHLLDEKAGHLASRRNSSERRPASGTDALRKPYFRRRDDSSFTAGASRETFVDSIRASTCGHRPRVPHGYTDMAGTCNRANPHGHERHAADVQPRPQFKFPSACSGFLLKRQITRVPAGRALPIPCRNLGIRCHFP